MMLPRKNPRQPPKTLGKILGQSRQGRHGRPGSGGSGIGTSGSGSGGGANGGARGPNGAEGAGGGGAGAAAMPFAVPAPPTFEDCVRERDYAGALAILDFRRKTARPAEATPEAELELRLWTAYCAFHAGDYEQALGIYQGLLDEEAAAAAAHSTHHQQQEQEDGATTGRAAGGAKPASKDGSSSSSSSARARKCGGAKRRVARPPPEVRLYLACCYYYLQMYEEAEQAALLYEDSSSNPSMDGQQPPQQPQQPQQQQQQQQEGGGGGEGGGEEAPPPLPSAGEVLRNRVLFHVAHKMGNEGKLLLYHQRLTDSLEDQLSLAAIHFLRSHFQEALEIYKRLLLENRADLALNVYVAMCYYKMDYYDVALEVLAPYLQAHPGSPVAANLQACGHFRLYNGKAAEAELFKALADQGGAIHQNELMRHNLVVFNGGDGALKVLPPLVDVIPEARLNLVIYYLKHDGIHEAFELLKDLEPSTPQEYVLKGVVHACLGQQVGSKEHLKIAQQLFQLVGASASECDTIPGRQCMASCFYLLRNFEDVAVYLNSVKAYLAHDDDFNWNYGLALAASGHYKAAEEALLSIQSDRYKSEYAFVAWLARCCIMNGNPHYAWELCVQMEAAAFAFPLLQLVANDCYRMGHFFHAAKAFEVLERLDPGDPEHWEGKRGACVGVFQMVLAGKLPKGDLREAMAMLRDSNNNREVEYILRVMKKWAKDLLRD